MKSKLLYLSLLIAVSSIVTGCGGGDEERLRSELQSLNSKISECNSSAESKYDMGVNAARLVTDEGSAANEAAKIAAAGARNYVFWDCMHR